MRRKNKGFSLIELMIVVAIIAILAMIMTPNLLTAIQKAKMKATMEDMRNIGMSVDNYMSDWGIAVQGTTIAAIKPFIFPFYTKKFADNDQWSHAYQYTATNDDYSVGSAGKNAAFAWPGSSTIYDPPTKIADFERDLVYSNGAFTYGPRQN